MPNARPAIAPRARPASRSFARAARPIIAAGPAAGPTKSPALWKHRLSTRPGWKACRTAFRTVRPPRRCARSAIWTSANFRRSFRRAASAGIDHPPLRLTHVMHRDLPRPSLRATPGALRYGRGSLLCITWISPRQSPMRGHGWTRKGGRNWKRIDRLEPVIDAAHTVKRHWDGILRWFDSKIANGLIEGINSLVQAAKAKARGYRSTRNLKAMVYLLAGKLDLRLPA